ALPIYAGSALGVLTGNPRRRIPYPLPADERKCVDAEPVKLAETASAVEASFAGAGVQRAAGPLWLGAGAAAHCWGQGVRVASGDLCSKAAKAPTEAEAETKAHWQVKGGSHYRVKGEAPCPGKVDACVNLYWVLPDAKFAGFAASPPLPRPQNIFAGRRKSV